MKSPFLRRRVRLRTCLPLSLIVGITTWVTRGSLHKLFRTGRIRMHSVSSYGKCHTFSTTGCRKHIASGVRSSASCPRLGIALPSSCAKSKCIKEAADGAASLVIFKYANAAMLSAYAMDMPETPHSGILQNPRPILFWLLL